MGSRKDGLHHFGGGFRKTGHGILHTPVPGVSCIARGPVAAVLMRQTMTSRCSVFQLRQTSSRGRSMFKPPHCTNTIMDMGDQLMSCTTALASMQRRTGTSRDLDALSRRCIVWLGSSSVWKRTQITMIGRSATVLWTRRTLAGGFGHEAHDF